VFLASTSLLASAAHAESQIDPSPSAPVLWDQAIVGGTNVLPGNWPDTVAVLGDQGVCTGTLIAQDVVLTAGHCAEINPTAVIANTTDYTTTGGSRVAVQRTVAYSSWENTYDVAVIVLAQPITNVTPRRVGTSCTFDAFQSNVMVRLVGFGATDLEGKAANSQLKEAMTAVTDPVCSAGNGCNTMVAPGGEFVAGGSGTADSCFGDSGGPVYLETPRGTVVVGAVSRGVNNSATPCGGGGIYVRTDKIVQWIEQTTSKTVMKDDCAAGPSGEGSGSGTGEGGDERPDEFGDVTGGCNVGGSGSASGLCLALAALLTNRRRRGFAAKPAEDPTPVRT
jgi:secreted trypsin-like serine protease